MTTEFELQAGQSVDYLADTTDLDDAVLSLEVSSNGFVWQPARDAEGALVADVVGDGGAESSTAVLRNEGKASLRYRAVLVEVFEGTLAGEIAITFTDRADPAKLEDVVTLTDQGVTLNVSVTAPAFVGNVTGNVTGNVSGGNVTIPIFADNAAALEGGLTAGMLWSTAAGVVATAVEA
jgi:hypothetical protein